MINNAVLDKLGLNVAAAIFNNLDTIYEIQSLIYILRVVAKSQRIIILENEALEVLFPFEL